MHLLHFSIRSSITWLVFSQNLVGQWQIIRVHIAHISHDGHDRRWCRFFRPVPLLALKRKCWPDLAIFGYFVTNLRTFWCPLYRPKKVWQCPKNDKYEVWPNTTGWSLAVWRPAWPGTRVQGFLGERFSFQRYIQSREMENKFWQFPDYFSV